MDEKNKIYYAQERISIILLIYKKFLDCSTGKCFCLKNTRGILLIYLLILIRR